MVNIKKLILSYLAVTIICLTVSSYVGSAASNIQNVKESNVDQGFVQKMSQYVKLDSKKKRYYLSNQAVNILTQEELDQVLQIIKETNSILNRHQSEFIVNNGKFTYKHPDQGGMRISTINTKAYWDYDLFWWGHRFYFHTNLIRAIKSHPLYIAAGAAMTTGTINAILTSSGLPGWIANILVACGLFTLGTIVYTDRGRGVYVDAFHGTVRFKAYSA
ncbi:hypothetical protein [Brevibacillus dissolubilis]|uniref:hypothetical protein n=1 Tax=Brevibacillus dissolubilis TaxID=1844116 RepID=UPI001115D482|nr:hypothetical protein [Brevibacillus dissolubilis]